MFDSLVRFMLIAGRKERAGTPVSVCDHCEHTYPEEWVFNNICPFCGEEHTNTDGATGYRPQPEVELDCDGYPTEEFLEYIRGFSAADIDDLDGYLAVLQAGWWQAEWGFKYEGPNHETLHLHTGGWSGNEDTISALQNTMFWGLYWQESRRGGHYTFTLTPRIPEKEKK